jgi:hypothetical protein
MRLANTGLVTRLKDRTVAGFFGDTANYITRTASVPNTYGEPTYTESTTAIACSFTDQSSAENWREFADVQVVDAEIRFTFPTPAKGDAITITGRFDSSSFTDRRYHIVGIKDRGVMGYVCALKAVDV